MTIESLTEAVFRLGQISADTAITNQSLLARVTQVAFDSAGADVVGVAVFEQGILNPAKACKVVGPWPTDESEKFLAQLRWPAERRPLAARVSDMPRNELYRRADLIDDRDLAATPYKREFLDKFGLGDQAIGIYSRPDETDLVFFVYMLEKNGPIVRQTMARARSIAPYIAHCWAKAWKREPAWVARLKPQNKAVLELVLEGYDDDQIAEKTGLTYHSVRAHLKRLFREAGVRSRLHLMQVFRQIGPAKPWESEAWSGENLVILGDPSESAFGFTLPDSRNN